MKLLVCLLALVCLSYQTPLKLEFESEFEDFIQKFGKTYKDDAEKTMRYNTFVENVKKIQEYAKAHPETQFGINKFTDWTKEEKARLTGARPPAVPAAKPEAPKQHTYNLPNSFDWRSRNMVTPVKDQGSCGSCWTFQAVAVIESNILVNGGSQMLLSEQEIVDCDKIWGVEGCEGGTSNSAFTYVQQKGLATEQQYPYRAVDQTCSVNYNQAGRYASTQLKTWQLLSNDENNAAYQLMQLGPIGYNIWVPDSLFSYNGGVYYPTEAECLKAEQEAAGHAITIVGFGTDPNQGDYWIIKNSWGTGWGDQGYFKMHRGNLTCSISYANPNQAIHSTGWFLAITSKN